MGENVMKIEKQELEKWLCEYAEHSYQIRKITRRGEGGSREFINNKLKEAKK